MACAVRIAKCNGSQFWNQIHSPQPFFDRRFEFPLQYVRHARCLQFRHVVLLVIPMLSGQCRMGRVRELLKIEHGVIFSWRDQPWEMSRAWRSVRSLYDSESERGDLITDAITRLLSLRIS